MKFSSIIRRALKPHVKGKPVRRGESWSYHITKPELATHTVVDVHFEWHTIYGESWRDRDRPSYKIFVTIVPIGAETPSQKVELDFDLESMDNASDRLNHKGKF